VNRVILFSLTAALNPTLLTATTVMLFLPNPKRLLLGYLLGALTTGLTVGFAIVTWLGSSGVVSTTKRQVDPVLSITLGLLVLLVAGVVGTGHGPKRKRPDRPKKTPRWQRALGKGTARTTFVIGVVLSFPGASYLAALTAMHRLDLSRGELVGTLLLSNFIMLALLEAPLIGYAVAPQWTPVAVGRFVDWVRRDARRIVAVGGTVIGLALIAQGVITAFAT
jgi:hypothetical protein